MALTIILFNLSQGVILERNFICIQHNLLVHQNLHIMYKSSIRCHIHFHILYVGKFELRIVTLCTLTIISVTHNAYFHENLISPLCAVQLDLGRAVDFVFGDRKGESLLARSTR